ncbi:MAG: radical SAM protein, partial [Candidatus Gracilibacteria bacterium]|nr:radical SAM protein [Candidatus Gracilibacteria bacterium]
MFCYIHIPFCESKCKYCRFASFGKIDKLKIKSYIQKLKEDIASFSLKSEKLKSIYFGGGTPSILDISELKDIINSLDNKFGLEQNIEITLETTPQNVNKDNLIGWKSIGINRISIGIQTLN